MLYILFNLSRRKNVFAEISKNLADSNKNIFRSVSS